MPKTHPPIAALPSRQRSRITNARGLITEADGRGKWARRTRDLMQLHVTDLGGNDNISEAERSILRRACVLITELERMESAWAAGEGAPDIATLDAYQRASNSLRRLLEATGLRRRSRDITPTLEEYLEGRHEVP